MPRLRLNAQERALERQETRRLWRIANREKVNAANRRQYAKDPEAHNQRVRAWRLQNPTYFMFRDARKRAEKRGLEFNIEQSDVVIPEKCPVFGTPLKRTTRGFSWNTPSLDRLDSSKGYVKGNVWVISNRANLLKNNATLEEMRQLLSAWEAKCSAGK